MLLYSPSATLADDIVVMVMVCVNALWNHGGRIHYRGIGQAAVCCRITDYADQADVGEAGINENGQADNASECTKCEEAAQDVKSSGFLSQQNAWRKVLEPTRM